MRTLDRLIIKNFKSIREQTIALGRLNVFIGGNGAGKSNLIGAFRFLREIVNQNLAVYTGTKGGADSFLHFGRKRSPEMSLQLQFGEHGVETAYFAKLKPTDDDGFLISKEVALFVEAGANMLVENLPSAASRESKLKGSVDPIAQAVWKDMDSFRVYHFHDTSDTAAMKGTCDLDDNRVLRPQAENLAAFLYWLQQKQPGHFAIIQDVLRQIAPFFDEFRLAPSKLNENKIRLEWKEKGSEAYFNAASLSDGTLRFLCLITLLLQPELPPVVLIDEPELGLHPAAIGIVSDLLKAASVSSQIIVATQSVTLVNQLSAQDVIVVDREEGQSVFRRPDETALQAWLAEYAMGELWEKNVIGGRP
jgi:predicted ATPase